MSRTLITRQNYREFLAPDHKSVIVSNKMILTPGAKDFLREQQIRIIYEDQIKENPGRKCTEEVKEVNGTFITLFHNESVSGNGRWRGWNKLYENLLRELSPLSK